jgi:hypothetical protein
MTQQELIQELQALSSDNPDREITRAFFRAQTGIKDSMWEPHYGSWLAFKAAAGLEKTKTERKFYSDVSKHAERDELRQINSAKQEWEGAFLKPSDKRFQSILAGSDFHDKLCDPFTRRLFIETARRLQPEKIILNGDVLDLYEFSRYDHDPRVADVTGAFAWKDQFLADLREAAPNSEITWTAGNHEERLIKLLASTSPYLMPLLADVHGMSISDLLGLKQHEVNFISKANLATFTESDFKKEIAKNYYIAYETVLFHHFPQAKNWGLTGQNGHHHTIKVEQHFNALTGPYLWVQPGAGHVRNASYCEAERWQNGFTICHVDTHKKVVQWEIIDCTHSLCCIGGHFYYRTEEETMILNG